MMVKSGLEFILKLTEPLQSCCCPVKIFCPEWPNWPGSLAGISEGAWSISKSILDHFLPSFFKLKNDNFKTRNFSPLIERVLAGVSGKLENYQFLLVKRKFYICFGH